MRNNDQAGPGKQIFHFLSKRRIFGGNLVFFYFFRKYGRISLVAHP
jgi:hypothetical protein